MKRTFAILRSLPHSTLLLLCCLSTLLSVGCAENPATNKPAAEVKEPTPPPAAAVPAPAPAAARQFIVSEESKIGFVGSKVTGKHSGGFKKFAGSFALAGDSLSGSGHKVVIEMTSLWADNDKLAGHLKSPDFFNTGAFPQSTFELTQSEKLDGSKVKLTGNLTLHGVTKQISFPAELTTQGSSASLKAEFSIKRFDFGIKYPGKADDLIRDEVVIQLDLTATAQG